MDEKEIKERIKYLRHLKCTKKEIAKQLGISLNAYAAIESGTTSIVNPRLKEIADILGKSEEFMLTGYELPAVPDGNVNDDPTAMEKVQEVTSFYEDKIARMNGEREKIERELELNRKIMGYIMNQLADREQRE